MARVKLALARDDHRGGVFRSVADDRDNDEGDPFFRDARVSGDESVEGVDEIVRRDIRKSGHNDKQD